MSKLCMWCGTDFEPRSNGGSAQRFCSKNCRQDFNTACRIWAAQEYEVERVSIFQLRTCLGQRACCVQRNPAPEGLRAAPEAAKDSGGPLRGAASMVEA